MKTDQLPSAVESEESLAASCLCGDAEQVLASLKPEYCYLVKNQKVINAVGELLKSGVSCDLQTLTLKLKDTGELASIGGATYLASLLNEIPVSTNIDHHAGKVRDKSILRNLILLFQKLRNQCFENSMEPSAIIDEARQQLESITEKAGAFGKEKAISYRELSSDASERYETLSKQKGAVSGIRSGFRILDSLLCGFQPGDLIVLAARPSQGKTALALNVAGHVARDDMPVAIFSLEMGAQQLYDRQVAGESRVNLQKFRTGRFDDEDWAPINTTQSRLYEWPIYIDDSAALHYQEIRRRAWALKKRHGIGLVIIDHLQLVRGDKEPTRDREIGGITAGFKAMAKDLNVPVILLSQLNRSLEARPNPKKRPRLSDLRDSGNIEQDSDVVAFLYRPAVYDDLEEFQGHTELIVAKHRNGPTGMIKLKWDEKVTRFFNLESERAV